MSLNSTEPLLEDVFKQPSLVFPSLHSNANHEPTSKYSYKDYNKNNEDLSANIKNLQSCIHYASRLIKLRSELRSPFYLIRSNSIGESDNKALGKLSYNSKYATLGNKGCNNSSYELSTASESASHQLKNHSSSSPSLLSEIGRAQSLPNVARENSFDYDKEDESEIFFHHHYKIVPTTLENTQAEDDGEQEDNASQLTYLSDLIRASLRRRQVDFHESRNQLALPPRDHFSKPLKESRSPRSISLRSMINEAIDEAKQPHINTVHGNTIEKPKVLRNSQSFMLASQLLYASSQNNCQRQTKQNIKGQEHIEEEMEKLLLDDKNKEAIYNCSSGVFDEKVEISDDSHCLSTCYTISCSQCSANTMGVIVPQPTKSHDNKSVFSSILSSDSEVEDEEDEDDTKTAISVHSLNKRIILRRKLRKKPQAFLVSLSPSSAAAASVARSRRPKSKQGIRIQQFS
ncbi:hypothetical protein [Parasitella parasitica]|uniref:Uncharacterized protein n=1 Tax=Parasitella parasitica TaxID=35722 RepID=A0A0B7N4K5_9FUNG|nr:hypothetical protein [Parasitella parasitica]